jgi:FecR protein
MKSECVNARRFSSGVFGLTVLSVGALLLAPGLRADDAAPPARAVRLSSVDGRVQISQDGQSIADPAVANTPLFEGTQVVTTDDGRAEIEFEEGSVARLSPNSSLTLTVLRPDDGVSGTEIRMDSGLGYFELQSGPQPGHIQVRFGDAVVSASGFTVLRVDMDNSPGELAVFSGSAHLERGSALSLDLHGGESVALNASSPSQYNLAETIEPDSWDTWNSDRDQILTSESSSRTEATQSFVNNANPAWNDLDANGNWYNVPGQGYVWSPYDAANSGWDPYGNGYWMFTPRFGYVWVSGDSWGYMPFSCGLWSFYGGFGWGWSPGMGACMPWWGGGIYGLNIGYAPLGYLPPRIPRRPPVHNPIKPGGRAGPYPMVAVNKRPPSGFGGQPVHDRNVSVTIAGHVVMPVRTLSPRPVYDRSASAFVNRTAPAVPGVRAPGGVGGAGVLPPGSHGTAPRPASAGGQHASAPRPASAPASHAAPSGGGGGGAAHASGGGGGGGGGGSHH